MKRGTKRMRLPNGFGQISKLKGRLRRPYRAMITVGKTDEGRPICRLLKPVSYFETYNDAYSALLKNSINPYDQRKNITLKELYEEWSEEAYKKLNKSTVNVYTHAWKYLSQYGSVAINTVKPKVIKTWLSDKNLPKSIPMYMKSVLNQMFNYALEEEIVEKNYCKIVRFDNLYDKTQTKHHITFSESELNILWNNKGDPICRKILIQCYTGLRPGELCEIKLENIHLEEHYMTGGLKTKAGRNRIIPIHPSIHQLINAEMQISKAYGHGHLLSNYSLAGPMRYRSYQQYFHSVIRKYQLNPEHSAHDPRKFFISTAKKYQLDEYAIKLIVGHAIGDITESVYTERSADWLYSEVCKISV